MTRARDFADSVSNLITISNTGIVDFEPNILYTAASPVSASTGTMWVDSTDNEKPTLKVYNGNEWIAVSGAAVEGGFNPFFGV